MRRGEGRGENGEERRGGQDREKTCCEEDFMGGKEEKEVGGDGRLKEA